jgi:hypothetical protein
MKKAIAFILFLFMIFSVISCGTDISSSSSSESEEQESSSTVKESESEAQSESQTESESESQIESESEDASSSDESSSEVFEESSATESESESESESEKVITEAGAFSSAITETKESADRLKQMTNAKITYNKGATCSDDKIASIMQGANIIKTGGSLLGSYRNASALMAHFLGNTGEDFVIDMDTFLKDENALKTRNEELTKALRSCEVLAREGESISVYQIEELVHHNLSGDWYYAVGSYFTNINVQNLTVNGNIYTATINYNVTDFYNWDYSDSNPVFSGLLGTFTNNISPKDLHELHRAGEAQEFLSHGEVSYTISWVKGSSVSSIPTLK